MACISGRVCWNCVRGHGGDSALIVGMQPILTAVFIGLILAERVEAHQWVGFVLGTLGVALVSPSLCRRL